jgi:hypothetical protein
MQVRWRVFAGHFGLSEVSFDAGICATAAVGENAAEKPMRYSAVVILATALADPQIHQSRPDGRRTRAKAQGCADVCCGVEPADGRAQRVVGCEVPPELKRGMQRGIWGRRIQITDARALAMRQLGPSWK